MILIDLQLIQAYIPDNHFEKVSETLKSYEHHSYAVSELEDGRFLIRILVTTSKSEVVLDYLEKISTVIDGFEVFMFPVQTYLAKGFPEEKPENQKRDEEVEERRRIQRASRQELIGTINQTSRITLTYELMVILSAIVVTIGFIKDSEAVIIGAMVIAPMLGPVIAVAFSAILGSLDLLKRSSITLVFAVVVVIFISFIFSLFYPVPTTSEQFIARTSVSISDIILALASGTAGALAVLNRLPGSLVGVMVAVALMPPTVVVGMSLGATMWKEAYGSGLLLLVNINSILLAAIIVFTLSGIRPVKWQEVQVANVSKKLSIVFVSLIILILAIAVYFGA